MKVFISWSGVTSRAVAVALSEWLPKVIQGVTPFVSAKDIDKGSNWTVELARELEDAQFGIVCIAPDNLLSPWLNYEAGAITKSVGSRVCPVLFGVEKEVVKPPIAQLQMTSIEADDFLLLMTSLNKAAGSPLTPEALKEALEVWWPRLDEVIAKIKMPDAPEMTAEAAAAEPVQPDPVLSEMISEVLHRMRDVDERLARVERSAAEGPIRVTKTYGSPAVLPDEVRGLMSIAADAGVPCVSASRGAASVELKVAGELPDPLPSELYEAALGLARMREVRVRIKGTNRTAVFEKNGRTDEF